MRNWQQPPISRLLPSLLVWMLPILLLAGCGQSKPSTPLPAGHIPAAASYPLTIANYDALERSVSYTYKKIPERVILTHPGATEVLLELGLEKHILSTTAPYGSPLARLADKFARLAILQAPYAPSQEELVEMRPDLLIGWVHHFTPTGIGKVKNWHNRDIGTYILPNTLTKTTPSLENTLNATISDFGKIFNIQAKTDTYITELRRRVAYIEKAVQPIHSKKTVLVLQDHFNGTFSLYGDNHVISTMISIAGGQNLCQTPASFVGAEKVLSFNPDFILFVSYNIKDSQTDLTDQEAAAHLRNISLLQSMRAIRAGNIINIPFFTVNSGGIRTVDAIEKIAQTLYPEKFPR